MTDVKKPSEKVLSNPYDGKVITDSLGRQIRLRKPNILDRYDLFSAMENDTKNTACLSHAIPLLHIATIDGEVLECPKSYADFRWALKKMGEEGMDAVMKFMSEVEEKNDEKKEKEQVKK